MSILFNVCRIILGLALVLSGFVKAVDPLGTQYKIDEYLRAIGLASQADGWQTLAASVTLSTLEFILGMLMLLAIRLRLASKAALLFMTIMTVVSIWLVTTNPVSDCGCFGDAIHLTNAQTLLKNIILTACAAAVTWSSRGISNDRTPWWKRLTTYCLTAAVVAVSAWALYFLPIIDFRPYHVGASIREGMTIPEGEKPSKLETTFVLEKNGERKEFTLDNYPDSTWIFIDSKTTVVEKGYEPPIHDFTITDLESGEDIQKTILGDRGYTILLISPYLEKADDRNFGEINALFDYAKEHKISFHCLTASGTSGINAWIDRTGAEYRFCMADATTLKTMIRSNPGLMLLRDGRVMAKWGRNSIPTTEELRLLTGKKTDK